MFPNKPNEPYNNNYNSENEKLIPLNKDKTPESSSWGFGLGLNAAWGLAANLAGSMTSSLSTPSSSPDDNGELPKETDPEILALMEKNAEQKKRDEELVKTFITPAISSLELSLITMIKTMTERLEAQEQNQTTLKKTVTALKKQNTILVDVVKKQEAKIAVLDRELKNKSLELSGKILDLNSEQLNVKSDILDLKTSVNTRETTLSSVVLQTNNQLKAIEREQKFAQKKIENIEKINNAAQSFVLLQQDQIEKTSQALEEIKQSTKNNTLTLNDQREKLSELSETVSFLEQNVQNYHSEFTTEKDKVNNALDRNSHSQNETSLKINALQSEQKNLTIAVSVISDEQDAKMNMQKLTENRLSSLQEDVRKNHQIAFNLYQLLDNAVQSIQNSLSELENKFTKNLRDTAIEKNRLSSSLDVLARSNDNLSGKTTSDFEAQLLSLKNEIVTLAEKQRSFNELINDLLSHDRQSEIDKINIQVASFDADLKSCILSITTLTTSLKQLEQNHNQFDQIKTEQRQTKQHIFKVQNDVNVVKASVANQEKMLNQEKNEHSHSKVEINKLRQTLSECQDQINQISATIASTTRRQNISVENSLNEAQTHQQTLIQTNYDLDAIKAVLPKVVINTQNLSEEYQCYRDTTFLQYQYFLETKIDVQKFLALNNEALVCQELKPILNNYFTLRTVLQNVLEFKQVTIAEYLKGNPSLKSVPKLTLLTDYMRAKERQPFKLPENLALNQDPYATKFIDLVNNRKNGLCLDLRNLNLTQGKGPASNMITSIIEGLEETLKIYEEYVYIVAIQKQIREYHQSLPYFSNTSIFQTIVSSGTRNSSQAPDQDLRQIGDMLATTALMSANQNFEQIEDLLKKNLQPINLVIKTLEFCLWKSFLKLANLASGLNYPSTVESVSKSIGHAFQKLVPFGALIELAIDLGIALHHEREQNHSQNVLINIGILNFIGPNQSLLNELPNKISNIWASQINQLANLTPANSSNNNNASPSFFKKTSQKLSQAKNKLLHTETYPPHMRLALMMGAVVTVYFAKMPVNFNAELNVETLIPSIIQFMRTEKHFLLQLDKVLGINNLQFGKNGSLNLADFITEPSLPTVSGSSETPFGALNIRDSQLLEDLRTSQLPSSYRSK